MDKKQACVKQTHTGARKTRFGGQRLRDGKDPATNPSRFRRPERTRAGGMPGNVGRPRRAAATPQEDPLPPLMEEALSAIKSDAASPAAVPEPEDPGGALRS